MAVTALHTEITNSQTKCQVSRLASVKNGTQKIRGANLGSWFVIEWFMSQDLFAKIKCDPKQDGQYLLEQCLYRNKSVKPSVVLDTHWSNFITESDFVSMSKKGINAVRLPVGWWNVRT